MVVGELAIGSLFHLEVNPNPDMNAKDSLSRFDPRLVAHFEKENFVAYYQKDWLKLLLVSVRMVKEFFHLSFFQAVYGAYLIAWAEIAAAPFPDNDIPTAEAYVRRFYAFVKNVHKADFNIDRTAHWEVNWWIIHRKLFAQEANQELVDALLRLYEEVYNLPAEQLRPAAYHRAQGMLYSDRWVNSGKDANNPLLAQVEEELVSSYTALKTALASQ